MQAISIYIKIPLCVKILWDIKSISAIKLLSKVNLYIWGIGWCNKSFRTHTQRKVVFLYYLEYLYHILTCSKQGFKDIKFVMY